MQNHQSLSARPRTRLAITAAIGLGICAFLLLSLETEPKHEGRTVRQWIDEFRSSDGLRATLAQSVLAHEFGEAATPALIEALSDPQVTVRWMAAETLGNLGAKAKSAVIPLIRALQAETPTSDDEKALELSRRVVRAAAHALIEIGPEGSEAVAALLDTLESKWAEVRYEAARIIANMGPQAKSAVPALTSKLTDSDKLLRIRAAAALAAIGSSPENPEPLEAGVTVLVEFLRDADIHFRWQAAQYLRDLGPKAKTAVLPLIHVLQAEVPVPENESATNQASEIVWAASQALIAMGPTDSPEVIAALIEALGARWEVGRYRAAEVLEKMGPQARAALPTLTARLTDPDKQVRIHAARALGAIGPDSEALAALKAALNDPDKDVRDSVASALRKAGES